jgi:hypothetical protein
MGLAAGDLILCRWRGSENKISQLSTADSQYSIVPLFQYSRIEGKAHTSKMPVSFNQL